MAADDREVLLEELLAAESMDPRTLAGLVRCLVTMGGPATPVLMLTIPGVAGPPEELEPSDGPPAPVPAPRLVAARPVLATPRRGELALLVAPRTPGDGWTATGEEWIGEILRPELRAWCRSSGPARIGDVRVTLLPGGEVPQLTYGRQHVTTAGVFDSDGLAIVLSPELPAGALEALLEELGE